MVDVSFTSHGVYTYNMFFIYITSYVEGYQRILLLIDLKKLWTIANENIGFLHLVFSEMFVGTETGIYIWMHLFGIRNKPTTISVQLI
mgnify:FL=1